MNLHEYQAKEILKTYGIPIPDYWVVSNLVEAEKLPLTEAVVKIQVHAGGRGKAGGVKFGKNKQEVLAHVKKLLGMKMVNNQTGPDGVVAQKLLLTSPVDIKKEYYLGAVIDRSNAHAILIASPEGGMEIEEVADKHPEKILTLPISLDGTLKPYHLMRLIDFMGWKGESAKTGMEIAAGVAKAFIEKDASLLEINPLVMDQEGKLWALDAKLGLDENALFRQKEIEACYDPTQYTKGEVAAKEFNLAYIALDGNIGCMVNGAGLAMATMDIIHHYGGKPANFLDVGGSATEEKVAEGFKIILSDPKVRAILVNIFGGIMNCATIAAGIIAAEKQLKIKVPLIVRLEGTNVEQGKQIIQDSGLPIITADSLNEAAQKSVEVLRGNIDK